MLEATYGDERERERKERERKREKKREKENFSARQLPLVALNNFSARCT
jgi:hypothetical protein